MPGARNTLFALVAAAALLCLSVYTQHSSFSAIWLAAPLAAGHTLSGLCFGGVAPDRNAKQSPSSRFNGGYFLLFLVTFFSLSVGLKYLDVIPFCAVLHCLWTVSSEEWVGGRPRICLALAAVAVVLSVILPFPSRETGTAIAQRFLGCAGVVGFTAACRATRADGVHGRESIAAIVALCLLGCVASAVLINTGYGIATVDSSLAPVALMASSAALTQVWRATVNSSRVHVFVGTLLLVAVTISTLLMSDTTLDAGTVVLRDVCLYASSVFLTLMQSVAAKQTQKYADLDGLSSAEPANSFLHFIVSGVRERKLAMYLILTIVIMFLECGYGVVANSLGLVSDSFHMLLDAASLGIGLVSAYAASSWAVSEKKYPFGYGRYETVGGFVNGTLLLFIAMYILVESAERVLDPPEIEGPYLLTVSVVGLLVNVLGILFFHEAHGHSHSHDHGHSHGGTSSCSASSNSGVDHNMRGVYLHIVADLLGSVSVIISSLLMNFFGWWIADPVCSAVSAILVFLSALPLLEETGKVLLLSSPESNNSLNSAIRATIAEREDMIADIMSVKLWVHSTAPREKLVCTVAAKLHDNSRYSSARDNIYQRITSTVSNLIGEKNVHFILHLE